MRIVQVITRRQRRGAEVFATQLADRLVLRGHDVKMIGLYPPPPDVLQAENASACDLFPEASGRLSWQRVRRLADAIAAFRSDLVQANGADTLKYCVLARIAARGQWSMVYRNISVASRWLRYPGQRLWVRWLVRQLDFVAAVSEESRVDYIRAFRVPADRIANIPIGVDIPRSVDHAALRAGLAGLICAKPGAPLLVHVGSFTPEKNHFGLLRIFSQVLAEETAARLIMIGEGVLRTSIEQEASRLGIGESVSFLGSRADAAELAAGGDLLLLTSRIEGLPGVILEAAAYGVPCVATNVGGIASAIDDGTTGYVIDFGQEQEFAQVVIKLLRDSGQRAAIGKAARNRVRQRFDMADVVGSFERLYMELIASEGPTRCSADTA